MRSLRLGLLLAARTWRISMGRTAAMAVGMIVAGLVAAAATGIPAIFDGLNQRTRANETYHADPTSQLTIRFYEEDVTGQVLHRIVLAGSADHIPGSDVVPGPGEVIMSPALLEATADEPLLAARFPQRVVGTIADDGLVNPGQLKAYIGTSQAGIPQVTMSFGLDASDRAYDGPTLDVVGTRESGRVMIGALLFLGIPAIVFLTVAARLSARIRDQRLATLRLLGLRARDVRLVNGIETALVAAFGSLVGVALWAVVQPPLSRFGVGGFRWFAQNSPVTLLRGAVIVLGATVLATVVATVSANAAIDEPLAARRHAIREPRLVWRGAVLAAGVTGLVVYGARNDLSNASALWLVVSGGLAAAGVTLIAPLLASVIGSALGGVTQNPAMLLLARRLRHDRAAVGRVVTGLLFATVVVGVAFGVVRAFGDSKPEWGEALVRTVSSELSAAEMRGLPGVEVAVPVGTEDPMRLVATCADLRKLLAQPLSDCTEGVRHELLPPGLKQETPYEPVRAVVPSDGSGMFFGAVFPPGDMSLDGLDQWQVRLTPNRIEEFSAALVAADPGADAGNWPTDEGLYRLVSATVIAGAFAALLLGIATVMVATADHALERRATDANLLAIGTPGRFLRRVQFLATAIPIGGSVLLAAIIGVATGHLYRRSGLAGDDAPISVPWGDVALCGGIGVTGAVLAGGLAWSLTRTRLSMADLRTE